MGVWLGRGEGVGKGYIFLSPPFGEERSLTEANKQKTNQPQTPNSTYLPPYPFSLKENKNSFLKLIVRWWWYTRARTFESPCKMADLRRHFPVWYAKVMILHEWWKQLKGVTNLIGVLTLPSPQRETSNCREINWLPGMCQAWTGGHSPGFSGR